MKHRSAETTRETRSIKQLPLKIVAPRVLALARPHTGTLVVGLVALGIASGINLLFPYLIGKALNNELGLELASDLPVMLGWLIALFAIQAGFFYVRHYCFHAVGHRVVAGLRKKLYQSMIYHDVAFFDRSKVGDLLSRLSSDTQLVQRAVTINISVAVRYLLQVLGGVVLMLIISPKLTLVIVVVVPVIVLGGMFWGKKLRTISKRMQEQLGDASVVAEETLASVKTVRVFTGEKHEVARYDRNIEASLQSGIHRTQVAALFASSMVFLLHSSIAAIFCYGAQMVINAQLSIGDLTAFVLYGTIVAVSFGFLAGTWDEFMQAVGASERIFETLDAQKLITIPQAPMKMPEVVAGSIQFDSVSFAYPSRPDVPVLKELSFEVASGQTVALVGPSGGGKSTIAALIPRFYDPQQGQVRYAGAPVTELNPFELREHISLVPQDPQVFSVSIGENIRYGKRDATAAEVEAAAESANLTAFLDSLPQGLDTLVGDRGIQLSGGQRQRIAIARAILKNPKFLVLDEATSSLDSENEKLVQQALERLMHDRTTLIIAHRLSTVQHADKVLVIKDGQIEQTGTHSSLVEETGLYRTLVEYQLL